MYAMAIENFNRLLG